MILFIIVLILYFSFYNYLEKLKKENCNCALNQDHELIKKFTLFYIGLLILFPLIILLLFLYNKNYSIMFLKYINKNKKVIKIITLIIAIFYFYNIYKYIHTLDTTNCDCSKSNIRTIMYYYSILFLFIDILMELVLIASLFIKNKNLDELTNIILQKDNKSNIELSNKNKKIINSKKKNIQDILSKSKSKKLSEKNKKLLKNKISNIQNVLKKYKKIK